MKTVRKNYHSHQVLIEAWSHVSKIVFGRYVRVGKTYTAITARDGQSYEGPFEALDYDKGNLLIGTPDRRLFFVLDEDVSDVNGSIYTENLPHKIRFKKDILDVIGNADTDDECCRRLRSACSFKWFSPLSSDEYATLLLFWHRGEVEKERKGYETFEASMSLDDYLKALQRCLMMSDWHYSEEEAEKHLSLEMLHVRSYYSDKEAPWNAAIDIGYICG